MACRHVNKYTNLLLSQEESRAPQIAAPGLECIVAGFIAGDPRRSEGMAWIATLGVLPEYRRQGIARLLLLECEKQLNSARLRLCVRMENTPAIQLYEKECYLRVGTWTKYYNDGGDALVMEKIQVIEE